MSKEQKFKGLVVACVEALMKHLHKVKGCSTRELSLILPR